MKNTSIHGTLDSLKYAKQLQVLEVGWNNISGNLNFLNDDDSKLKKLYKFDGQHTSLIGTIDPLVSLPKLRKVDLSYTKVAGTIPKLNNIEYINLENNHFYSNGLVSISLPNASYVNIRHNNIRSGNLARVRLSTNAVLDISDNNFDCPYPELGANQLQIRDSCDHDWTNFLILIFVVVGVTIVCGVFYLLNKEKLLGIMTLPPQLVTIGKILLSTADLISDWIFSGIMLLTPTTSNLCTELNKPIFFESVVNRRFDVIAEKYWGFWDPPETLQAYLLAGAKLQGGFDNVEGVEDSFRSSCREPACTYDPENKLCLDNLDYESSRNTFKIVVCVVLVIYTVKEAMKLALVLFTIRQKKLYSQSKLWYRTSIFSLLLKHPGIGNGMWDEICAYKATTKELYLELIVEGLFEIVPQSLLAWYFLVHVQETGLTVLEMTSILISILNVNKLFIVASVALWRDRRAVKFRENVKRVSNIGIDHFDGVGT